MVGADRRVPRFSVLIPLEHPRGIAEDCIRVWATELDYPRDAYELLIAAPPGGDPRDLGVLRELLAPHDRLLTFAAEHDIGLVAAAATEVAGELLVMTESHCIPEPDFLRACDRTLAEHPEWDGFSGGSIPVVHNALSQVEAEMYVTEIDSNLREHPWLKVLDQCFVVRRDAYEACGGLEPEYGHFAEHLLAARLFRAGKRIGYDSRAAVSHHYVGDIDELLEFAHDFGRGQVRFARSASYDPCGDLFDPPLLWRERRRRDQHVARRLATMLLRDMRSGARPGPDPSGSAPGGVGALRRRRPRVWRWLWRAYAPARARHGREWLRIAMARLRLSMAMRLTGPGARSQRAFVELNALAAGAGGSAALAEHPDDLLACPPQRSEWSPLSADDPGIGFHDLEVRQHRPFRWSEPAALVALLATGRRTHITIEWVPLSGIDHDRARFYIDEQPLPASAVEHRSATTVLTIDHEPGPMRLGWVIEEACADGDPRPLGLPVFAISWGEDPDVRRPAARAPRSDTRWRRDQPRAGSGRG